MDAPITHETLACVIASLGMHEYWPRPKGDTGVEYILHSADRIPVLAIEMDLQTPSLTVRLIDTEVAVTSVFDNGSGFQLRWSGNDGSSEFVSLDHMDGTLKFNHPLQKGHQHTIKTPRGDRNDALQRQIESLREQIPAKESDEFSYV